MWWENDRKKRRRLQGIHGMRRSWGKSTSRGRKVEKEQNRSRKVEEEEEKQKEKGDAKEKKIGWGGR